MVCGVYKRIKDLREDNDLTQKDIANYSEVYRSTYAKWEDGTNKIPLRILDKLSTRYNVSFDYILGLTNIKKVIPIKNIDYRNLSKRLKLERKNKDLSQESIANILDITKSTYGKYELGLIIPSVNKIIILANFYQISIDYLTGKCNSRLIIQDK